MLENIQQSQVHSSRNRVGQKNQQSDEHVNNTGTWKNKPSLHNKLHPLTQSFPI